MERTLSRASFTAVLVWDNSCRSNRGLFAAGAKKINGVPVRKHHAIRNLHHEIVKWR
jgi:hypothetical protein